MFNGLLRRLGWGSPDILDIAEKAMRDYDYPALAESASQISLLSGHYDKSYLVEPLIRIAERLANNSKHIPQSVAAFSAAAGHAPSGSVLEQQAVAGIIKYANYLLTVPELTTAFKAVVNRVETSSALEQSAIVAFTGAVRALPHASDRLIVYKAFTDNCVSPFWQIGMEGIVESANSLPTPVECVDALSEVLPCLRSTPVLEQNALNYLMGQVRLLATPAERAKAFMSASHLTNPVSALQEQAVAGIVENAGSLEKASDRVAAFMVAAWHAVPNSALEQTAVEGFVANINLLETVAERADALKTAAAASTKANPSSLIGKEAIACLLTNVVSIPIVPQRIAILKSVIDKYRNNSSSSWRGWHTGDEELFQRAAISCLIEQTGTLPISERINLLVEVVGFPTANNTNRCDAIAAILENIEALPEIAERIPALLGAAHFVEQGSKQERQVIAEFWTSVTRLPSAPERVAAFETAAIGAVSDSPLEREALAGFRTNVFLLSDPDRINALSHAARFARPNSVLEREACIGFFSIVNSLSVSERIEALIIAVHGPCGLFERDPGSNYYARQFYRQATDRFFQEVKSLPDFSSRLSVLKNAASQTEERGRFWQAIMECIIECVGVPPVDATQMDALKFVIDANSKYTYPLDCETTALEKILTLGASMPNADERIAAFICVNKSCGDFDRRYKKGNSEFSAGWSLRREALENIVAQVDLLPDLSDRRKALEYVDGDFYLSYEGQRAVSAKLRRVYGLISKQRAPVIPDPRRARSFLRNVRNG